jgi:hypothetical protein
MKQARNDVLGPSLTLEPLRLNAEVDGTLNKGTHG